LDGTTSTFGDIFGFFPGDAKSPVEGGRRFLRERRDFHIMESGLRMGSLSAELGTWNFFHQKPPLYNVMHNDLGLFTPPNNTILHHI